MAGVLHTGRQVTTGESPDWFESRWESLQPVVLIADTSPIYWMILSEHRAVRDLSLSLSLSLSDLKTKAASDQVNGI